ncbi:hypothetical protein EWB00_000742 [Schistosoma japonicum]|uniref:Uncharacterized protein n=2 Tax=Schistosoma japonicum TaxID=6182 RepID=A0A4Z2DHX3_SCHJA|nr:hypothetical protein KSF78_0007644 [Schistosoma japonicum]TNN16091.1 hypothetical protein EWB00_000742 [Schistosoma japonicum]
MSSAMNHSTCILKDHFTLPPEDSSARYLNELTNDEQILKGVKLKKFLSIEQKRSKLYRSLLAKVHSNIIDGSSNHGTDLSSRTITTITTPNITQNNDKQIENSIEDLSNRAKALSLYSFHYLVKSLRLKTSDLYKHKARQMRQAIGRRIYSDAERKRACHRRQNKEDQILSENIKAKAEKQFLNAKSNKALQSINYSNKNVTQIDTTNISTVTMNTLYNSSDANKLNEHLNQTTDCNNELLSKENEVLNKPQLIYSNDIDLCNLSDSKLNIENYDLNGFNNEMLSLWHRLDEKIPPLCLCMQYSHDNDDKTPQWFKCANNCKFHHNPEGMSQFSQLNLQLYELSNTLK